MPDLVVPNVTPRVQYLAGANVASLSVFSFNFGITSANGLKAYRTPTGTPANDASQLLTLNQDYTVTILPPPAAGGTITLTTPANLNDLITIVRDTPPARVSNYSDGSLSASSLNNDFNTDIMIAQENDLYNTTLSPHYNVTAQLGGSDYVLPRLNPGCVWVKSLRDDTILAEPVGGITAGNILPIDPINIGAITVFNDFSGNITSRNVTIDATNNISGAATINCTSLVTANIQANGTTINGALTVNNTTKITGLLTLNNGLQVTKGNSSVTNLTVTGQLTAANFSPTSLNGVNQINATNVKSTTIDVQTITNSLPAPNNVIKVNASLKITGKIDVGGDSISTYNLNTTYGTQSLNVGGVTATTINTIYTTSATNNDIGISPGAGGAVMIWPQKVTAATPTLATQLQFYDKTGTFYTALKANDNVNVNTVYTLPPSYPPGTNTVLNNDGNGILTWTPPQIVGGGMKAYVIFRVIPPGNVVEIVKYQPTGAAGLFVTPLNNPITMIDAVVGSTQTRCTFTLAFNPNFFTNSINGFPTYLINGFVTSKNYDSYLTIQTKTINACTIKVCPSPNANAGGWNGHGAPNIPNPAINTGYVYVYFYEW